MNVDIIIVGAGTAGMTSAIYALRNNKSVLMLESTSVGGQIAFSPKVENFPSYQSISGSDFSNKLFEQVLKLGANFELETVTAIVKKGEEFVVGTDVCEHTAKCVIIANGVKQKHLPIEAEERLLGNGVYYCAICDGAFYKGKEVAIVGGGDSALTEALYLSDICLKVYVLVRKDLKASDILQNRVKNKDNIVILKNVSVSQFISSDSLTGVLLNDGRKLDVNGLFIAIGGTPDISFLKNLNVDTINGYIKTDNKMRTNIKGLYAVGDVRYKDFYQIITAASDGAIAALSIREDD